MEKNVEMKRLPWLIRDRYRFALTAGFLLGVVRGVVGYGVITSLLLFAVVFLIGYIVLDPRWEEPRWLWRLVGTR